MVSLCTVCQATALKVWRNAPPLLKTGSLHDQEVAVMQPELFDNHKFTQKRMKLKIK